jgi:DNA polymerase/3'-5' exonuclease PolX
MSDKPRWPIADAREAAARMMMRLQSFCERIEIVGSVRRGKPLVGDVELLFIPKIEERKVDMFITRPFDLAHEAINAMIPEYLTKRKNVEGHFAGWGDKNKLAVIVENGMPIDLFSTTTANWFVSLVVRTGGKENNLKLTTGANRLGRTLNAYGCGVTDRRTGEVIPATSEEHVFELCGEKYLKPEDRT